MAAQAIPRMSLSASERQILDLPLAAQHPVPIAEIVAWLASPAQPSAPSATAVVV
jgi:hypothetical protein